MGLSYRIFPAKWKGKCYIDSLNFILPGMKQIMYHKTSMEYIQKSTVVDTNRICANV